MMFNLQNESCILICLTQILSHGIMYCKEICNHVFRKVILNYRKCFDIYYTVYIRYVEYYFTFLAFKKLPSTFAFFLIQ